MAYEIEILSDRFDASSDEVWDAISYYSSIHLSESHGRVPALHGYEPGDLRKTSLMATVYNGVYIEMSFAMEGSRHIWSGATFAGDGPYARHEHVFGHIDVAQPKLSEDRPVDVRIVCSWPPLYYFFLGLSRHLARYFQRDIYRESIVEYRDELVVLLASLGAAREAPSDLESIVDALRAWAASVDRSKTDELEGIAEVIDDLEEDPTVFGGTSGYLELNVPIIPKLLSYKWRIGVEAKPSLRELWEELKRLLAG